MDINGHVRRDDDVVVSIMLSLVLRGKCVTHRRLPAAAGIPVSPAWWQSVSNVER